MRPAPTRFNRFVLRKLRAGSSLSCSNITTETFIRSQARGDKHSTNVHSGLVCTHSNPNCRRTSLDLAGWGVRPRTDCRRCGQRYGCQLADLERVDAPLPAGGVHPAGDARHAAAACNAGRRGAGHKLQLARARGGRHGVPDPSMCVIAAASQPAVAMWKANGCQLPCCIGSSIRVRSLMLNRMVRNHVIVAANQAIGRFRRPFAGR